MALHTLTCTLYLLQLECVAQHDEGLGVVRIHYDGLAVGSDLVEGWLASW